MKHPIPTAALDDRLGFIGTSGSGKTYNAGTAIEMLLGRKARAVIVDPLGAWWGLRLLADGKTPSGFDVVIFGGEHGDLPLNDQAGALIGETVATMAESCIIDLSKLPSRSAERRFMVAFLETLYRKAGAGDPFHLVVDEADLFAPQKPQKGDEVLLGHMDNIVRRGRMRGFIPWLISQRPAVLNKNVLSQVDGLLAFKLTSSQDRDAIDAWIEGQADKAQGKEIKDSLPTFQIGEGLIWLPGHGILERKTFPQKITFDSSRKPKRGEKVKSRKLKPLDVGKLEQQIAAVVEQAKASDVPTLQKRIRDLEQQLKKAEASPAPAADPAAIAAAEERGFKRGLVETEVAYGAFTKILALIQAPLERAIADTEKRHGIVIEQIKKSGQQAGKQAPVGASKREPAASAGNVRKSSPASDGGGGNLTNPQLTLLQALAWWKALGHDEPGRPQIAAIARWKPTGSNLSDRLSELKRLGLVEYPRTGVVRLTSEGIAAAPEPDMGATMLDGVRSVLTSPQLKLFDVLWGHGQNIMERPDIASELGWEATGSNLSDRLSELKRMELVEYPTRGQVKLAGWLFQ